jgi:hypothetical protein
MNAFLFLFFIYIIRYLCCYIIVIFMFTFSPIQVYALIDPRASHFFVAHQRREK